ncbi:hypothetical protein [Thermomonas sp.]|jgi:hypothetical protein|uniref:hypothetical protein n=1 Tax=Thermomonas sp. TaxID=1971895 RepID=UPI00257BB802|nr:hypothetical protein [Thermomonas sp.]
MSADALPHAAWRAARLRALAILAAFALPWLVALAACAQRFGGRTSALLAVGIGLLLLGFIAVVQWRHRDVRWLLRALNARSDMEDSADLLAAPPAGGALRQLQRQRLQQRLAARPADLRLGWPWPRLAASTLAAALLLASALLWPPPAAEVSDGVVPATPAARSPLRLASSQLQLTPPRYTGLPARRVSALSASAPQGTQLRWTLAFNGTPDRIALVFLDGRRLPLQLRDGGWQAELRLDASVLYRIELDGRLLDAGKPHRLDALPDRPPQLRVLAPARSLSLAPPTQSGWELAFDVEDDYGVATQATLQLTLAKGSGENITFRELTLPLQGQGASLRRRFSHRVALAALGLQSGDDLIARLVVRDNRSPQPQLVRSPALILRLQAAASEEPSGIEGVVKRVLPAYFRSQRQIILDAEALLKQKPKLAAERYLQKSDALGVDQRILRLRYGQFLGEESEDGPALPTADAGGHDAEDGGDHAGHDHPAPAPATTFGQDVDLLETYGHTHDHADAATLLDPQTRATLKLALDQMWQSELQLRQGHPERALPFAYKALGYIKQVQQAERIYLARVGPQLPPIDEGRRLGGKREGLAPRPDPLRAAPPNDADIAALWQQLDAAPARAVPTQSLAALQAWLRRHGQRAADPLALQTALDALQRDPACAACRDHLRALLWPLLPTPPAAVARRPAPDAQGQRYLDALDAEAKR